MQRKLLSSGIFSLHESLNVSLHSLVIRCRMQFLFKAPHKNPIQFYYTDDSFLQKHSSNLKTVVKNMSNLSIYVAVMHMQSMHNTTHTLWERQIKLLL